MFTLEPDEDVIGYYRKHWLLLLRNVVPFIVATLIIVLFPSILGVFLPASFSLVLQATWFILILVLLYLWMTFFIIWTNYYLDVWVLTNRKLITANQRRLFSREVATLELEKIQDISIEMDGFIQTFFEFGTIRVQTAAEKDEFVFKYMANPESLKQEILMAQRAVRETNMERQSEYVISGLKS